MITPFPLPTTVTQACLLAMVRKVPGAWLGLKMAAVLLVHEGQRPSWIAEVLGVTRMSESPLLGLWGSDGGTLGATAQATPGTPLAPVPAAEAAPGSPPGAVAAGRGPEPHALGWADPGRVSEQGGIRDQKVTVL